MAGDPMMDRFEREALDRHITGNYGEDELDGELIEAERLKAMVRLLLDSGDITPMGARLLNKLAEEEASDG